MADPLAIVGAGPCGGHAVEALRPVGYDRRLILIGTDPDVFLKQLMKAA